VSSLAREWQRTEKVNPTMHTSQITVVATILFGIAAMGGLVMAFIRLQLARNPPAWLAMAHGLLAGSGLTLLVYAAATTGLSLLEKLALGLFIIAALGGVGMNLLFHSKQQILPIPLMIFHGLIAASGFLLMLVSNWNQL
jgi:hypothetical protein